MLLATQRRHPELGVPPDMWLAVYNVLKCLTIPLAGAQDDDWIPDQVHPLPSPPADDAAALFATSDDSDLMEDID